MPSLHYGGTAINVPQSELASLMEAVLAAANDGNHRWLMVNASEPTWLLVGPGIAVRFDKSDDRFD